MSLEDQRDIVKRLLKQFRRKATLYSKDYIRAREEKHSQAVRSFADGMAQGYLEAIGYMEHVLEGINDAIEHRQPVVTTLDEGDGE